MADKLPWPGLSTDPSPHIVGARVSENCRALRPGILSGRGAARECWGENFTARGSPATNITSLSDVLALSCLRRPEGDMVVFLLSDGTLHVARRIS
jgi:hypothetical protein